jgi:hypothetical protein
MDKDLMGIQQKTLRYWFEDGLSEIVIGTLFFIVGAITLLQGLLMPGSNLYRFLGLLIFLVITAGTLSSRWLIRMLKERLTYPRTGYVAYKPPTTIQRTVSLISGIVITIIILLLVILSSQMSIRWIPLILGFMMAGFLFVTGLRTALLKYQFMAIGFVVIGLLLSFLNIKEWLSIGIMLCSLGLMFLLSGLIALIHYVRNTQPCSEIADGS